MCNNPGSLRFRILSSTLVILCILLLISCGGDSTATPQHPTIAPSPATVTPSSPSSSTTVTANSATSVVTSVAEATVSPGTVTSTSSPQADFPLVLIMPGFQGNPFQRDSITCHWWNDTLARKDGEDYRNRKQAELDSQLAAIDGPYGGLAPALTSLGYHVSFATYLSSPCYTDTPENNVPYLMNAITAAQNATNRPGAHVIIIAHSTGGIVARAYTEDKTGLYRGDVDELITVGTPYDGVVINNFWFAFLTVPDFLTINAYIINQHIKENFEYFPPTDPLRNYQDAASRNPNVNYFLIGGDIEPPSTRGILGRLTSLVGDGKPNDGLVPLSSSLYLQGVQSSKPLDEGHDNGYGDPYYFLKSAPSPDHAYTYIVNELKQRIAGAQVLPVANIPASPAIPHVSLAAQAAPSDDEQRSYCRPDVLTDTLNIISTVNSGIHINDALGELHLECGDSLPVTTLARVAAAMKLPVQLISYNPDTLNVVVAKKDALDDKDHPLNIAGTLDLTLRGLPTMVPTHPKPNPDLKYLVQQDIPGSFVITNTNPVSIFVPPDAIPSIRITHASDQSQLFIFNSAVDHDGAGRIYDLGGSADSYFAIDPNDFSQLYQYQPPNLEDPLSGPSSLALDNKIPNRGNLQQPDSKPWVLP